jgi:NAD(P)-dependent dehydrogenase (short-subunit alcohol dehydrogenase family)
VVSDWTTANIPSQVGRSVVVTGTGGLGLQYAFALARAGTSVIIAGRNASKGSDAVSRVRQAVSNAVVRFEQVDLASLASVASFGTRLRDSQASLDLLINNAAVMTPPKRQLTVDGFELQFGTNFLGHFALTAALLPLLRQGGPARVVNVSSVAARKGRIDFDDLQAARHYKPMAVYSQSKLANLMFSLELQRRSAADRWGVDSIAAHPGISRTDLIPNGVGWLSVAGMVRLLAPMLFQHPAQGALPILFAATSPEAKPGAYYGPDKMDEMRGSPAAAKVPELANDATAAARLWDVAEQLAGVSM